MSQEKNSSFLKFIQFVVDLAQESDVFYYDFTICAKDYFRGGGCYELFKIVQYFYPEVQCYINSELNHCAIYYHGKLYDSYGEVCHPEDFSKATEEDFLYMERSFRNDLVEVSSRRLIPEILLCRVQGILY